ncbi:hypothetical protein EAH78_19660 [Pseudomonas arsenicoxydans]|uniref:Uncharacterized protein n=1 Tax=Pseudomonas arsenicoxydans TaxID=702115 RepID=A0A502HLY8_9PSED|nr:hypothetical protein EAH78_19660 [Pseudomonas arsenicoxydans]
MSNLWRGSLLPLDCAAGPFFGAASLPNGGKPPHHSSAFTRVALFIQHPVSLIPQDSLPRPRIGEGHILKRSYAPGIVLPR